MFGGPLMIFGLVIVGWLMLWARPFYGFAATYALGLLLYIIAINAFYGMAPMLISVFGGFMLVIGAVVLGFLIVGLGIVALRKRMKAGNG